MSNKLEDYVKENKKAFEAKGPSDQLWERISAELDQKTKPKKSIKLYQWMSIAVVLALSMGLYFTYNKTNRTIEVADVNSAFGKKEVRFASLIEEKRDSLQMMAKDSPALYGKFIADMSKLASDYDTLKKQLQTSPNSALVVKAMMKNLEIQLQIIDQQLLIINQVNQYKEESII